MLYISMVKSLSNVQGMLKRKTGLDNQLKEHCLVCFYVLKTDEELKKTLIQTQKVLNMKHKKKKRLMQKTVEHHPYQRCFSLRFLI